MVSDLDYAKYLGTYSGGFGGDETVVIPWQWNLKLVLCPVRQDRNRFGEYS